MENYVLVHHGTKGMKWGVRRYQNKDGSLTPAGKKRYAKELDKIKKEEEVLKNKAKTKAMIDKLEARRAKVEEQKESLNGKTKAAPPDKPKSKVEVQKSVHEMSDDELNRIVNRLNNEKRYNELRPQQVSRGKKFVEGLWDKAIEPAIQDTLKNTAKKALGSMVDSMLEKKKT